MKGSHTPRGAYWDGKGVNFSLLSAHATRVELCLFDSSGTRETGRVDLPEYTDEVWHSYVPEIGPGTVYGYRCTDPTSRSKATDSIPASWSSTPYARAHVGELKWEHAVFGYTIGAEGNDLTCDSRDSAPFMPKCGG